MIDSLTDRTETFLSQCRRAAVPLIELAEQLRADPESLRRQLEHDDRFVLIPPTDVPDLTRLTAADREAYTAALRAAGVHTTPSVALARPEDAEPGGRVDLLLRNSVARLLALTPDPGLAAAAERIRPALRAALGPALSPPLSPTAHPPEGPGETAPSTTPPRGRTAPARVPPRRRTPSPPRPPYPGSRRG